MQRWKVSGIRIRILRKKNIEISYEDNETRNKTIRQYGVTATLITQ